MKVSSLIVTYNHERYLAEAIESALRQEVPFEHEVVIGEDCSTDRTREIALDLQRRHPDRIRLLLHDRNLGANRNFVQTLRACRGQYIAILEGDDYWTRPDKLRKQTEFLEAHPECALSFHCVKLVYEGNASMAPVYPPPEYKTISTLEDILERNFIQTCSTVFRNGLIRDFPDWFFDAPVGDWPLHVMNAVHGHIGFLPQIMGVHRMHGGGVWSSQSLANTQRRVIETRRLLRRLVDRKHHRLLAEEMARDYHHLAVACRDAGQPVAALAALANSFVSAPCNAKSPARHLLGLALQIVFASLLSVVKRNK